jgi:hypothetical protein
MMVKKGKIEIKKGKIEIPAVRLEQRGLVLYQGKIKARELLECWDIKAFEEEYLKRKSSLAPPGYQREPEKRANDIATYVRECQIPLVPSLLLASRELEFEEFERGFGILRIPRKEKAIAVIDGQHRGLGFARLAQSIAEEKRLFPTTFEERGKTLSSGDKSELETLLDFELPATFVDSNIAAKVATEKIDKTILERELGVTKLNPESIERVFFFIVNKTAKSINPSLKDVLMYYIASAGIKGIPIIEREEWRADAVPLVRDLHYDRDSPLRGLVNLIGRKGAKQPVKMNTFVGSLRLLVHENEKFQELTKKQQVEYIKMYWKVLKEMFENAFKPDRIKQYLILTSLSVHALNWLADDVFRWCQGDETRVPSESDIKKYLDPLKDFKWDKDSSPIGPYGGYKGARAAYKLFLKTLSESGINEAKQRLQIEEEE